MKKLPVVSLLLLCCCVPILGCGSAGRHTSKMTAIQVKDYVEKALLESRPYGSISITERWEFRYAALSAVLQDGTSLIHGTTVEKGQWVVSVDVTSYYEQYADIGSGWNWIISAEESSTVQYVFDEATGEVKPVGQDRGAL